MLQEAAASVKALVAPATTACAAGQEGVPGFPLPVVAPRSARTAVEGLVHEIQRDAAAPSVTRLTEDAAGAVQSASTALALRPGLVEVITPEVRAEPNRTEDASRSDDGSDGS